VNTTREYAVPETSAVERRAEPRTACHVPVVAEVGRIAIDTILRDVSVSGAFVQYPGGLSEGQRLRLTMTVPLLPWSLVVGAEVRWVQRDDTGRTIGGGVRFDGMRAREMRAWVRYVRTLEKSTRDSGDSLEPLRPLPVIGEHTLARVPASSSDQLEPAWRNIAKLLCQNASNIQAVGEDPATLLEQEYQEAHAAVLRLHRDHQETGRQLAQLASRPHWADDVHEWARAGKNRCEALKEELNRLNSAFVAGVEAAIEAEARVDARRNGESSAPAGLSLLSALQDLDG